jgi:hypothetical protein
MDRSIGFLPDDPRVQAAEAVRQAEAAQPERWTAPFLIRRDVSLWADCATCRSRRGIDLRALAEARPEQPVGEVKGKCRECLGPVELVTTWLSERRSPCFYNFTTGEWKGKWRGPFDIQQRGARRVAWGRGEPVRRAVVG